MDKILFNQDVIHLALGKRNSSPPNAADAGTSVIKKERIELNDYRKTIDDENEDEEINVVDTSDTESDSLALDKKEQSACSVPVQKFCHASVIKSNSIDSDYLNSKHYTKVKLLDPAIPSPNFESPLDLSNKRLLICDNDSNLSSNSRSCFRSSSATIPDQSEFFGHLNGTLFGRLDKANCPVNVSSTRTDDTLFNNGSRQSFLSLNQNRPSVIKSPDIYFDQDFPDVEEHFRKSLGSRALSAGAEPKVDDHFARALGNLWWSINSQDSDASSDLCNQ